MKTKLKEFNSAAGHLSRRAFLKSSSAALAMAAIPGPVYLLSGRKKRNKMILSFYMDDTNPEIVKAEAFKYFLDYCTGFGIQGESSVILGYSGKSIADSPDDNERVYLWQARQAYAKGIDSHMEIMTHNTLFDFTNGRKNEGGIHEGLWLHEPGVKVAEYQEYFSKYWLKGRNRVLNLPASPGPDAAVKHAQKDMRS